MPHLLAGDLKQRVATLASWSFLGWLLSWLLPRSKPRIPSWPVLGIAAVVARFVGRTRSLTIDFGEQTAGVCRLEVQ